MRRCRGSGGGRDAGESEAKEVKGIKKGKARSEVGERERGARRRKRERRGLRIGRQIGREI